MEAKMPIIAITISSSIKVKPLGRDLMFLISAFWLVGRCTSQFAGLGFLRGKSTILLKLSMSRLDCNQQISPWENKAKTLVCQLQGIV